MDLSDLLGSGSNVKDLGKKKRGDRYAKLKQSKLDARREQWLAQVKNKDSIEDPRDGFEAAVDCPGKKRGVSLKNEMEERGNEKGGSGNGDWEFLPLNSPGSFVSLLASNSSGTRFSGSSGSSICSGSGSGSEEDEEEDDGCLDDWEAIADALGLGEKIVEPSPEPPVVVQQEPSCGVLSYGNSTDKGFQSEGLKVPFNCGSCRAWKPDDAFRPQSLPNLAKQLMYPVMSDVNYERKARGSWVHCYVMSVPSSCPVCFEDLDMTDTSFLPCVCGFRLCLFCHKRILEDDGRCPGCRKPYETRGPLEGEASLNGGTSSIRFTRSISMITGPRK